MEEWGTISFAPETSVTWFREDRLTGWE